MDPFTLRALTVVKAAKRQETLDSTLMKKATKRWATPQLLTAPDQKLLGLLMVPLSLSWSSLLEWKMRRCWAIASVTAAPQSVLILPCTCPTQLSANVTWPVSALQQPKLSHFWLLSHLLPESAPLLFPEGWWIRKLAAVIGEMCRCLGSTSGFCMNVLIQFFLQLSTCLCLAVSVLNQSSPMMNVKKNFSNVLWYIFIIFNYFHWRRRFRRVFFNWLSTSVFCSFIYITTSFSPHIVQYHLRLRGQGENISLPCFVTSVEVSWCIGPQFFILSTFNVTVERAFVTHHLSLFDVRCEKNMCIRSKTIWALSYHIVWHSQCTELKALTWP